MQSLEKKLEGILNKFSILEENYIALEKASKSVKEENLKLKSDIYSKTEEINVLRERFDNFKKKNVTENSGMKDLDSAKMQKEIMHYIGEVEKCLEWLNKY